jgi:hypothetical protein
MAQVSSAPPALPPVRRAVLSLAAGCLVASLVLVAGPVTQVRAVTIGSTLTGAPAFPELGAAGGVLSIDGATALPPAGSGTYTTLNDLVLIEDHPNELDPILDGTTGSTGGSFHVTAPAPFVFLPGSGTVSVGGLYDRSVPCGSLRADLSVSSTSIDVVFHRIDARNPCIVTISGAKVVPTASGPPVPLALLTASSSGLGFSGTVGALALITSQGTTPTIGLTASPGVITWGGGTTLTARLGPDGANLPLRLEQSFDGRLAWTAADVVTTDSQGVVTYPMRPRFNRFYRFAFVGGGGLAAGVSNAVRVPVRFMATLSPLRSTVTTIRRGTSITFTVRAQPTVSYFQRPFIEFRLYHRSSSGWRLATTKVLTADATGRASWKRTFAVPGDWYVRARAEPTFANSFSVLTPPARYHVR